MNGQVDLVGSKEGRNALVDSWYLNLEMSVSQQYSINKWKREGLSQYILKNKIS